MINQRIKITGFDKEILVKEEEPDPLCLRASIGGSEKDGYYLVFRGNVLEIENMLEDTLSAFRKARVLRDKKRREG